MPRSRDTPGAITLSPQERRRRNREQLVTSILEAARAVMRERGVADLSLREVARRMRMSAPSLYEYFPSKAALYDALFRLGTTRYWEACEAETSEAASFWGLLESRFTVYMRFAREHTELYQLIFEHPVPGFVPSEESMQIAQQMLDDFTRRVRLAIESGEIETGLSVEQTRDLIIAMMQGLTSQHIANDLEYPPGGGRYGGLAAPALALFRCSWSPPETPPARRAPSGSA